MNEQKQHPAAAPIPGNKSDRIRLLSGIGFYKMSKERRKLITIMFFASLGVHIIGLAIFGGWVVMRAHLEEKTIFKAPPPPRKTYEPKKLEHKVKVQKRQRSSSRPTMIPRMVAMKPSNLSLPEIKMDPKVMNTSFQPKFKAVSGKGVGAGLGGGYGTGGFGAGVSKFDFFGIKGRGDKICILVDVSTSMVEEERGGTDGFQRVKSRVNQVIDALHDAAMFNVVVFADSGEIFEDELVIANDDNKKRAKAFIRPFNTDGSWGLTSGKLQADPNGLPSAGGTTRLDLALSACFQQGADTILIISDGAPRVMKAVTNDEYKAHRMMVDEWNKKNANKIAAWDDKFGNRPAQTKRVWVPPEKARPPSKKPPKEGEAPDMGSAGHDGYWKIVTIKPKRERPKCPVEAPKPRPWTLSEFLQHLKLLHEHYYSKKGMRKPIIHCIGYQIDREGNSFLKALAKEYKGRYRKVKKISVK